MRKIVMWVCVCVCLMMMSACDTGVGGTTQEVTLTAENFEEYFIVERTVENYRVDHQDSTEILGVYVPGSYQAFADVCVTVRPRSTFEVNNVSVDVTVYSFDSKWDKPNQLVTLQIGADGTASSRFSITSEETMTEILVPNESGTCSVKAASGTISITK